MNTNGDSAKQHKARLASLLGLIATKISSIMVSFFMSDPFSRPSLADLKIALADYKGVHEEPNRRSEERLELIVPGEVRTARGNMVDVLTRDISKKGIGLLHRGSLQPDQHVNISLKSSTREFCYKLFIRWCTPCSNGMFISGGTFEKNPQQYL